MNKLTIWLDEEFSPGDTREVRFSSTIDSKGIQDYVQIMRNALCAFGFHPELVKQYLPEDV